MATVSATDIPQRTARWGEIPLTEQEKALAHYSQLIAHKRGRESSHPHHPVSFSFSV
jgi:hypothetical protein